MEKLTWRDCAGQTTSELIAGKGSHRIDSLLFAFEMGIKSKEKAAPEGEANLTNEECLVLAVMELQREVNNGGYDQFFVNSSRWCAPIIVECLRRIECHRTAAITERAIAALRVGEVSADSVETAIFAEDPARDEILEACDKEFYGLDDEITAKLFSFVEAHQDRIQLIKGWEYPFPARKPSKPSNVSALGIHLLLAKKPDRSLEAVRQLARELARQNSIPATDAELEAAAVLDAFQRAIKAGDFGACEALAPRAFELTREEPMHIIAHRQWVEKLLSDSQHDRADAATLTYLEYLKGRDQTTLRTQNAILFWVGVLQENRAALPQSVAFFTANFPEHDLDKPLSPLLKPMPYRELKREIARSRKKG